MIDKWYIGKCYFCDKVVFSEQIGYCDIIYNRIDLTMICDKCKKNKKVKKLKENLTKR